MKAVLALFSALPAFLAFLAAAVPATSVLGEGPKADIASLSWLSGAWGGDDAGMFNEELWIPPKAGSMLAVHRDVKNGKTVGFEFLRIEEQGDSLVYFASVAGRLSAGSGLLTQRPFRAPHHGASAAALAGGGVDPRPGELSLAHFGVLFLDELPEFRRDALEALREPLEDGIVSVARVAGAGTFPARFLLVGAMNPCPCGFRGDPRRACSCSPRDVARYRRKISGPLLDRIDLHVEVPALAASDLGADGDGEASAAVRARVQAARARQAARTGDPRLVNAAVSGRLARSILKTTPEARALLTRAVDPGAVKTVDWPRLLRGTGRADTVCIRYSSQ